MTVDFLCIPLEMFILRIDGLIERARSIDYYFKYMHTYSQFLLIFIKKKLCLLSFLFLFLMKYQISATEY